MNIMKRIRTEILAVKQREMAVIAKVSQATVCKWENGELEPGLTEMSLIRAEAERRQIPWNDAWFFKLPEQQRASA